MRPKRPRPCGLGWKWPCCFVLDRSETRTHLSRVGSVSSHQGHFQPNAASIVSRQSLHALAIAVAYWAKALSVETEKIVQANRDKLMQQELERYLQHAIGRKPTGSLYAPTMHRR